MKRRNIFSQKWDLFFSCFFLCPLLFLIIFFPPQFDASLPWVRPLFFSFFLALCTTVVGFFLSLPLAFQAARAGIVGIALLATVVIPFFIPVSISSVLFFQIFDLIFKYFGLEGRGTYWGILGVHIFYEIPIFIFYLALALRQIPQDFHKAMHLDGFSPTQRIIPILSMIRMPILQAMLLVFLYVFQSTALVMSLGVGRYQTMESQMLILGTKQAQFSQVLSLGLIQFFILLIFYKMLHVQQTKTHSPSPVVQREYRVYGSWPTLICALIFLFFLALWILPLFLQLQAGISQLMQVWTLLGIGKSMLNSFVISLLASLVTVVLVGLAVWHQAGKILPYTLFISQVFYFSSLTLLGVLFSVPDFVLGIWGLVIILCPYVYFFLKTGTSRQEQEILHMARWDGTHGWALFTKIYWPLYKERIFAAFWNASILAFGNFSFSYLLSTQKFPLAPAVLSQLLHKRYIAAANVFSLILIGAIVIPLIIFYARTKTQLLRKKSVASS